MEQQPKKGRGPKSKLGKVLINALVTLIVGSIYFYVALPAINLHDSSLYVFVGVLCIIYFVCALITSGMNLDRGNGVREYFRFIKSSVCPSASCLLL